MTLKTLFTAVGRLEKRSGGPGRSYPVIVLGGRDYMVDLQEMLGMVQLKLEDCQEGRNRSALREGCSGLQLPDRPYMGCLRGPPAAPGASGLRKRRNGL